MDSSRPPADRQGADHGAKPQITRHRTGCLTCRGRRIRCDEKRPACQNCSRGSRTCRWGKDIRFVFHQPEGQEESSVSNFSAKLRYIPSKKPSHLQPIRWSEADKSEVGVCAQQAIGEIQAPHAANPHTLKSPGADDTQAIPFQIGLPDCEISSFSTDSTGPLLSELSQHSESSISAICRGQSARLRNSIDFEHSLPIPPNLEPNGEPFTDWETLQASELIVTALDSDLEMRLMRNYMHECAAWFDVQNSQRHYSKLDVPRMMNCPPWRAAALAVSAKNMELREGTRLTSDSLSLHLYQLSVSLAIDSISGRFDCVGTLAGCVLLAVYEMMTVTYTDWRRHLQGCASIFTHNRWNGSTGGLITASFWNYARIGGWKSLLAVQWVY